MRSRSNHRPLRESRASTQFPPSWSWSFLLLIAFIVRWSFVVNGHPAFNSDEASSFEWAWRNIPADDWDPVHAHHIGIPRIWLARWVYGWTGWECVGSLIAVLLNLTACSLWVRWISIRISIPAAWGTALYLAFAPSCIAFHGTLLDARQESFIYAALLFLGSGRWTRSALHMAGAGFLAAWGTWVDPLFLAFLIPAALLELHTVSRSPLRPPLRRWVSLTVGILIGSLPWLIQVSEPAFRTAVYSNPDAYARVTLSEPTRMIANLRLLAGSSLEYLMGNVPYGFLQDTHFFRHIFPPLEGTPRVLILLLYGLVVALSSLGWFVLLRSGKGIQIAMVFLVPMASIFAFFVAGPKVVNAWGFRLLGFGLIVLAVGWGLLIETLRKRVPWAIPAVILLLVAAHGSSWFHHQNRSRDVRAGRYLAERLQENGLTLGTADYWVSEVVRFDSGGRVELTPHSSPPFRLDVERRVLAGNRIALLFVDGRDTPSRREALMGIFSRSFEPIRWIDRGEGWQILELRRRPSRTR